LSTYTGDLSACLSNCSNQGVCVFSSMGKYMCHCNQYSSGLSCQTDTRPCSSGPCLNNGICSNTNNETSFQCDCSPLYSGINCENKVDLCLNNTDICYMNQGYCVMNDTQPVCKCLMDYYGAKCELMSSSLVVRKAIISVSTIIVIVIMVCFILMVLLFDFTKYFLMNKKKKKQKIKNKPRKKSEKHHNHPLKKQYWAFVNYWNIWFYANFVYF